MGVIRLISSLFNQGQHTSRPRPPEPDETPFDDCLPRGCVPLETQAAGHQLPGSPIWLGQAARVVQTATGELVTLIKTQGMKCGCGHVVFSIDERVTDTGVERGIGGFCHHCAAKAEKDLKRGRISIQQAQVQPWYCTGCAAYCEGCGRRNICSHHAKKFKHADGQKELLCDDCLANAKQRRFFQGIVKFVDCVVGEEDDNINGGKCHDY